MALAERLRHCGRTLLLAGLLLLGGGGAFVVPTRAAPEPPPAGSAAARGYPGIEQLAPMAALLSAEAQEARGVLSKAGDLAPLIAQSAEIQQALLALDQNLSSWGTVTQWSEARLLGARQRLTAIRSRHTAQLDQLSGPLKAVDELRRSWAEKHLYWREWQNALQLDRARVPAGFFSGNRTLIQEVVERATATLAALNEQQQKIAAQQEVVTSWLGQIDGALASLRGPLLERNAAPLLSREFFSQIDHSLWAGLGDDLRSALSIPTDFAPRQGWVALLQAVLALTIAWQLRCRARQPEPVTAQWRFLFRHPLAGGFFITLLGSSFLYISPPMIWRWGQLVIGTVAATVLISAMLDRPRLRRVIIVLAVLFVCSTTIQLAGMVQPLHRLFLVGVCLIATPLCLAAARRQRQRREGRPDLLAVAFYLGVLAGAAGLVAQLAGYYSLSAYLVNVFLGTAFVYLFARMAVHLGDGGIEALFASEAVRERRFVQHLGAGIVPRLKILWHVIVGSYATLYLLARWELYPTASDAWKGLRALSFKIGELHVSVEVILMTLCVLYLTFIVSWLLQALLDAEVMTPRGMEHGVKFAIKTLLHYSLILVGFLVAISVAGVDMSKFAILAGALGVGIGFGLQNIVNNFLSGLILLFERPIKIGDTVSIDDQWGTITGIGLRSTVIETLDRSEVIVPNSELIAQKVTNWTLSSNVSRVVLPVGVAYGTPLEEVLEILLTVAGNHGEVLESPAPSAIFTGFGDSAINFELRVWIADINQRLRIRSELGLAIDRQFRAAGIVIPFPQRDLHLQSIAPNLRDIVRPPAERDEPTTKDAAE